MNKTILFDFDGTITDSIPSNRIILKIFNQIANENNFPNISLAEIEKLRDLGLYESIKLLKIPLYKLPFLAKRVRSVLKVDDNASKPIKLMPKVLGQLKKEGYVLGIMTSNHTVTVEKFLKKHKLELFDFIYSGSNLFGKDISLNKILIKHKLDIRNVIYVGDEIRDVKATKKIGLSIIAVTWGYNSKKGLSNFEPEFIAEKPTDLPKIVAKFFNK